MRKGLCRSRGVLSRGLASAMAAIVVLQVSPARGAPADVFDIPAPAIGSDPPKEAEIKHGDASVSTQTGALTYRYPIVVPPGRNGMAPHLALSYSSQAPIYGGIAAGWSLDIPSITEDTSQGRLLTHSGETESAQGAAAGDDDRFTSSLAGHRPLLAVSEPNVPISGPTSAGVYKTYRAQNDASFARYERLGSAATGRWRVYTTDGTIMYFGEPAQMPGCDNLSDGFAPLTRSVDQFGNEVRYDYEVGAPGECRIKSISWGQNAHAGVASFAQVAFGYASLGIPVPCAGIHAGSQHSYRTGKLVVTGESKLAWITATAFAPGSPNAPVHTRSVSLTYSDADEACNASHAPVRLLTGLWESAWGTDSPRVDLPPVTFEYGDASINLMTPQLLPINPWLPAQPAHNNNLAWGFRGRTELPTVEAMMIDIDGDGLPDRLINDPQGGDCQAKWWRNQGAGQPFHLMDDAIPLPRLKWAGVGFVPPMDGAPAPDGGENQERCALNGQQTRFHNSIPASACHDQTGTPCTAGSDPTDPATYCAGGTLCPGTDTGGAAMTFLAYRWLDIDGDGLVDLVTAIHGDSDSYDIVQGNEPRFLYPTMHPEPQPFGPWPACPTEDRCKALNTLCMLSSTCTPDPAVGQECTIDWGALSQCLQGVPTQSCHSLISADQPSQPVGGGGGGGGVGPQFRAPYSRCEGLYPWFVYKNLGNGHFATTPVIKYQPVPLESDTGDSAMMGPAIASQNHGILDFDGDGILDAVARPRSSSDLDPYVNWWYVWLGDGTGGFRPKRYTFPTRLGPANHISGIGTTGTIAQSSEGLLDVNGDGLPDHWQYNSPPPPATPFSNVAFNTGSNHRILRWTNTRFAGEIDTAAAVKPGNDSDSAQNPHTTPPPTFVDVSATNRVVDVDADGRPDVVSGIGTSQPTVFFNAGGQWITPGASYLGDKVGLARTAHVDTVAHTWELTADLVDLEGHGIPASTYFFGNSIVQAKHSTNAPVPRLLYRVHNGHGAHTTVTYSSMHDADVVKVPADRTETWFDGRPKLSPHNQWVVKSIATTDDYAGTSSTTSYVYRNPRHGPDDQGRYGFRGFEEITATAPSGAKTVHRYGYNPDWSGRLETTLVVPAEAPGEVRSIDKTTWEARQLFNYSLTTYHPTVTEHLTCANGQTEATCTAASAPGYSRTTTTLTAVAQFWAPGSILVQSGPAAADGDRETVSALAFLSDATTYRVRPLSSTHNQRVGGVMQMFAKSAQTWDPTLRVALTNETWFDANDANRAISRSVYDMTTGNLLQHFKPKQNAANTTSTTYTYDARKLFATTIVNELGHQVDYTFEYGTGTKLQTDGPNTRACTTTCPSGAIYPVKEQDKIRVDGLGRPIEKWETFSDDGNVYTLYQTSTTSYIDTAPRSVTHRTRYDSAATFWKQVKADLDGHGRTIRTTVYAQGSAPSDAITQFAYRGDGTLQSVSVPDPTKNDASLVTYTYGFDSLGRPTSIRRPDATTPADQSGVDIVYDGVTKTVTEVVKPGDGQPASTTTVADRLGRLVQVREKTDATTSATTTYAYGPDDSIASVVDPEGVTTLLTHDFAGRRTQIERANGRKWKFAYDKNGNVIAEQVPGSPNPPATDLAYTTTFAYDDLDRITSKIIGQRNLSAADQSLFASGTETYQWDYGANHTGFLRYWQSFAPGSSTAAITLDLYNNNQGQRTLTKETMAIAGYPSIQRQLIQSYFLFGGVLSTSYRDWVNGSNQSASHTYYDQRLLPTQMLIEGTTLYPQMVGVQTRNVAGLVTKRRTNTPGAMTFVESNWTYDSLGRVTSQVVQKGPGATQIARQDLAYNGNDDPKSLDHYLGATRRSFAYGFDLRHQLTSATETTTPGYFSASYQYGAAGRLARVTESQTTAPAGSEIKPRDVNYHYNGTDPEEVTIIDNVAGGHRWGSYTYDLAGNQLWRCYGAIISPCAESVDYIYDGKDHLRRATKKQNGVVIGSEEYWYDGNGSRIAIVKRDANGAKTELVWFLGDTEAHYDGNGNIAHVYSHLSLGTPIARIDRTSNTTTNIELQFHGLGRSTLAAVDLGGAVNASFVYAPFGETIENVDGGAGEGVDAHRRRHNDKYVDEATQLAYYGARYYDKQLIGWTQSDPAYRFSPDAAWTEPRRASLYAMTRHNPLRYIDPDGRDDVAAVADQTLQFVKNHPESVPLGAAAADAVASMMPAIAFMVVVGAILPGDTSPPLPTSGRTVLDFTNDFVKAASRPLPVVPKGGEEDIHDEVGRPAKPHRHPAQPPGPRPGPGQRVREPAPAPAPTEGGDTTTNSGDTTVLVDPDGVFAPLTGPAQCTEVKICTPGEQFLPDEREGDAVIRHSFSPLHLSTPTPWTDDDESMWMDAESHRGEAPIESRKSF
jgi:RHS repeat-associated protein